MGMLTFLSATAAEATDIYQGVVDGFGAGLDEIQAGIGDIVVNLAPAALPIAGVSLGIAIGMKHFKRVAKS